MKKIVYVDMDGVLADFDAKAEELKDKHSYPQATYGFFENLEPMFNPHYMKGNPLERLEKLGYDVFILTSPSQKNPLCYTEKRNWVEKILGERWLDKLIISPRKDLNKGDFLIDDNVKGKGQENFEGCLIQHKGNWEATLLLLEMFSKFPEAAEGKKFLVAHPQYF